MPIIETKIRHFQNDDTVELQKKIIFMRTLSFLLNLLFYYKADGCGEAGIWSVYNSQCYQCINDTVSWQTARSSCQQLGAALVTINNAGTQNFTESVIFFIS